MKKFTISILTALLLTPVVADEISLISEEVSSSEYTIEVKSAWDLLGALKDIKDMSIFNRDCVNQVWIYSDTRGWANYNKSEASSGFLPIDEIKAGRGFWVKGNEECSIEIDEGITTFNLSEIMVVGKSITYSSSEKGSFTETYYANGTMQSELLKNINMSWSIIEGKLQGKSEETFTAIPPFIFASEPKVGDVVEADFYGELKIESISDEIYTRDNPKIFTDKDNFYIKLESNPITGYGWSIGSYSETLFKEPTINYLSDNFEYLFFEFKDISEFTEATNIVLNYKRSFEEEIANSLTFEVLPIRNLTKDDKEVNLNRDESEFKITLQSNLTTGFSWKPDYNSSIFFEPTSSYKVDSDLIGAGGVDNWYFKVKDINLPENSTIKMDYAQHFDGGEVGESVEFKINFAPNSYDIKFGETINIDNGKLIIKFEDITDSRCAEGAQCITAGDVDLQLGITGILEIYEMQFFKLGESKSNAQSYSITLSDVKPFPSINEDINKSNYIATINIIKP